MTDRNASLGEAAILGCQFCGKPPKVGDYGWMDGPTTIWCEASDCMAPSIMSADLPSARAKWNTRTPTLPSFKDGIEAAAIATRLEQTLLVMKSARLREEPMAVWSDDVKVVEDAIRALSGEGGSDAPVNVKGE